jgi:hypothetical protein
VKVFVGNPDPSIAEIEEIYKQFLIELDESKLIGSGSLSEVL